MFFQGNMVSVIVSSVSILPPKVVLDNKQTSVYGYVSIKLYLQGQKADQISHADRLDSWLSQQAM